MSYTISGGTGGSLTFFNTSGNAQISLASTSAAQIVSAPISLSSDLTVTSNSNGLTLSGGIAESGSHSVTLAGGSLVLSGTNSYTGSTNLNAGTLRMGGANAASRLSTVVLSDGATMDLNSNSQVIGGVSGAGGTVTTSARAPPWTSSRPARRPSVV